MKKYKSIFTECEVSEKIDSFKSKQPKINLKELQKRRDQSHRKLLKLLEEV